jgi:hypothetical protein
MAGSKKKKSKVQTRAKSTPKRAAPKDSRKKVTKPTKKAPSVKKVAPKKAPSKSAPVGKSPAKRVPVTKKAPVKTRQTPAPRQAPAPPTAPAASPKSFVEKVRDCDAGTGVWFITAGSVEHAAIQKLGSDGAVVILTDAGVTEVVPASNLFETAEEARAARY